MITWETRGVELSAVLNDDTTLRVYPKREGGFGVMQWDAATGEVYWEHTQSDIADADEARLIGEAYVRGAGLGFVEPCKFCGHRYAYPCANVDRAKLCGNYWTDDDTANMINDMFKAPT